MFCPNCGSKIPDGAIFCDNCGAPVQPGQTPESNAAPPRRPGPPPVPMDDDQTMQQTVFMEDIPLREEYTPKYAPPAMGDSAEYGPGYGGGYGEGYGDGYDTPPRPEQKKRPAWVVPVLLVCLGVVSVAAGTFAATMLNDRNDDPGADSTPSITEPGERDEGDMGDNDEDEVPAVERVYAGNGTGGSSHTWASYDSAIDQGAEYVEQDVAISAEGTLYVRYDNWTYIPSHYDWEIEREMNPLQLYEVFDTYGKGITYVVELKGDDPWIADEFIDLVDAYGYRDNVIVHSFYPSVLSRVDDLAPSIPLICLIDDNHYQTCTFDEALDLDYVDMVAVNHEEGRMTQSKCDKAHDADKKFVAWSLDDKDTIIDAIEMGVDSYFTTKPGKALELEEDYRR